MMSKAVVVSISESSQAGEARRLALALAAQLGFNETERGKVGIVVTEVAKNLVQHALDGRLVLQALKKNNQAGIEILALDNGPGMENVSICLRDGYSTAKTPGNGLGAINRLSTLFDIHSILGSGTAVLAQLWANPSFKHPLRDRLEHSGICLPMAGEEVPGDAWAISQSADRSLLVVVDGLGHGPMASCAAKEAVRVFQENDHRSPKEIVEAVHQALRSTRGAAMGIADINFEQQSVQFVGIGNISATVVSPTGISRMVSHNGTVGHEVRKIQVFTYPWHPEGILIMHSDGLGSHWQLDRYLGLTAKHPSIIAGVLVRDFNRGRDDVTVVVAREENQS